MENLRKCRRCLTRELMGEEKDYFRNLHEYVANLDPDIKADQDLYERRLACCKGCDWLDRGMCRQCGCYVELRAAIGRNDCPGHKW